MDKDSQDRKIQQSSPDAVKHKLMERWRRESPGDLLLDSEQFV